MLSKRLPRTLIRLRSERGWSQGKLSSLSGVGLTTVSRLERGLASDLSIATVHKLCMVFGVGYDYLLLGDLLIEPQECSRRIGFPLKEGRCTGCETKASEPHALPDCILSLDGAGMTYSYISRRFGLTLRSVEIILDEEYRIRRLSP